MDAMPKLCVVIPALNPTSKLIEYIEELLQSPISQIIVVNDGSKNVCRSIFETISRLPRCTVLTHHKNKGKGRALKTAFQYILNYCSVDGVITADADGQHAIEDVLNVGKALQNHPQNLILGVRNFEESNVPFRSFIGNKLTSKIFRLLFNIPLYDTQTGLRGIPIQMLSFFQSIDGERYEYEMNMLIIVAKKKIPIKQVPIQTIYINGNKSSYYHPIKDSLKIMTMIMTGVITTKKINEGDKHGI